MTLKDIAELAAERAGRQFELPFRKELEDMIIYKRAKFIKDTLEKRPANDKYYMMAFLMKLEEVNKEECEELGDCGCENVLRTVDYIPDMIRYSPNMFNYVGAEAGNDAYAWTTFGAEKFLSYNPYTGKRTRYTIINRRGYIFREKNIKIARFEGVPSDPRELSNFTCPLSDTKPCYDPSTDIALDNAMIELIITSLLEKELRILPAQEDTEIYADKNK